MPIKNFNFWAKKKICWYCAKACNIKLCSKPKEKIQKAEDCNDFERDVEEPLSREEARKLYNYQVNQLSEKHLDFIRKKYLHSIDRKEKTYKITINNLINTTVKNFELKLKYETAINPLDKPTKEQNQIKLELFKKLLEKYVYEGDLEIKKKFYKGAKHDRV